MPNIECAAVTARVISRTLRKAGFLMADTSDRFRWTEGYHVSRVGCSRTVSIDYHIPRRLGYDAADRQKKREMREKMMIFLQEKGYVFSQPGYVDCERE